jgi:hypothetical protein
MGEKKRFLLRIDSDVHGALEKWASDEMRSVNAQIEYLLTDAARRAGRLRRRPDEGKAADAPPPDPSAG